MKRVQSSPVAPAFAARSSCVTEYGDRFRITSTSVTWLADVSIYYYKARAYAPGLGRFLQTDPILYSGGMNLYAYVGNDPINGVDPMGLLTCFDLITHHHLEWSDGVKTQDYDVFRGRTCFGGDGDLRLSRTGDAGGGGGEDSNENGSARGTRRGIDFPNSPWETQCQFVELQQQLLGIDDLLSSAQVLSDQATIVGGGVAILGALVGAPEPGMAIATAGTRASQQLGQARLVLGVALAGLGNQRALFNTTADALVGHYTRAIPDQATPIISQWYEAQVQGPLDRLDLEDCGVVG